MTVELPMLVVFCSSGLDPAEVEPDFAAEHAAATASGYTSVLVVHDELVSGSASRGVRDVGRWQPATAALYRGWMLPVGRYEAFYLALEARGISLINSRVARGNRTPGLHAMLNIVGEAMKTGVRFEDGSGSSEILDGYECRFRAVQGEHYREHFGYGIWFYGGPDFPALQLVWPDRSGLPPWQEGASPGARAQPLLFEQ